MSFQLASDLKTRQIVWIQNGKIYDPIQVCAQYRRQYASDVRPVTIR